MPYHDTQEEGLMSDMLVVSSKIKKFVREKAGFNTSAETLEALSQRVEPLLAAPTPPQDAGKEAR